VPQGKGWMSLTERIQALNRRKAALEQVEIPSTASSLEPARRELANAESRVVDEQSLLSRLIGELSAEEQEVARVEQRLFAIKEDIKQNQDSRTLRQFGSRKHSSLAQGSCPVCHQSVADALVLLAPDQPVMSLDENIQFLQEQARTFQGVLEQARRVAAARQLQVVASRTAITKLRERVQQLRQSLISDGRAPSLAAVYERVELERDLKQDIRFQQGFEEATSVFEGLAKEWRAIELGIAGLPDDDLSEADRSKLRLWQESIREQLKEYGFKSLDTEELEVSAHTYRPEVEGFELQTSISASDLIRTIWAYQHGMLEVARVAGTNHPGMVLFDEPRQQSSSAVSFVRLLKRVSSAIEFGQQVILFTSEERERLDQHLTDLPHYIERIEGRVLQKLA
jgi:hypothetical protein